MNILSEEVNLKPINVPYFLSTSIPCYVDSKGHRYFDELWIKDLIEHVRYINELTLGGPVIYANPPVGYIDVTTVKELKAVRYLDFPGNIGMVGTLLRLPGILRLLWNAVQHNKIIHTSIIAGWPIPYGWMLTPMASISNKFLLINVESAFWRLPHGMPADFRKKARAQLSEYLGRWCVNRSDLALFTQEEYKNSLLTNGKSLGYVDAATWIDEKCILPNEQVSKIWNSKEEAKSSILKVIFVGRLTQQKGVNVLLDAMRVLESNGTPVELDILGDGELLEVCAEAASLVHKNIKIRVLGTLPYNEEFYKLLHNYHLIVVPTISDEQPRIIYDAFAQALPVFASNTSGNRDCIKHLGTGFMFEANSVSSLSDALAWAAKNMDKLSTMGRNAVNEAALKTHTAMHRRRWALLQKFTT